VIVADPVPDGGFDSSVNGNDSVPVRFPAERTAVKGALIVALVKLASGIVALNVPFPIPLSTIVPLAVIPEAPILPVAFTVNVVVVVAASDAATARIIRDKVVHVRFMGCNPPFTKLFFYTTPEFRRYWLKIPQQYEFAQMAVTLS
jgi:hypothetical protein